MSKIAYSAPTTVTHSLYVVTNDHGDTYEIRHPENFDMVTKHLEMGHKVKLNTVEITTKRLTLVK